MRFIPRVDGLERTKLAGVWSVHVQRCGKRNAGAKRIHEVGSEKQGEDDVE